MLANLFDATQQTNWLLVKAFSKEGTDVPMPQVFPRPWRTDVPADQLDEQGHRRMSTKAEIAAFLGETGGRLHATPARPEEA